MEAEYRQAIAAADAAVEAVQSGFFATPYRPTGLSTSARAVVRLVDELRWLNTIVLRSALTAPSAMAPIREVCDVKRAAAEVLATRGRPARGAGAHRPARGRHRPAALGAGGAGAREHRAAPGIRGGRRRAGARHAGGHRPGSQLPLPGAELRRPADRGQRRLRRARRAPHLAGEGPGAPADRVRRFPHGGVAARRARTPRATRCWLHNSIRGAVGLGLAILVADLLTVQHAFWVAFATLAVLRSSALNTGQNIVRAVVGTTDRVRHRRRHRLAGRHQHRGAVGRCCPSSVLLAGLAPATVSFAAGRPPSR